MDKDPYLLSGIPPAMPSWNSFSLPQELNSTLELTSTCMLNPIWEKPNDHFTRFQSALNSSVSSPAVPPPFLHNDAVGIGGIIEGLGPTGFDVKPQEVPIVNEFLKENLPNLAKSMALNPSLARVWSSPTLKQGESPIENKIHRQTRMEINKPNELPRPIGPNSKESSSISEQVPSGDTASKVPNEMNSRKRKAVPKSKAKENVSAEADNAHKVAEADDGKNAKRAKMAQACPDEKDGVNKEVKEEEEGKDGARAALNEQHKQEKMTQKPPEPPKDYIHVRARRGQATDSHSLAERVRREKISERMKLLQDLVPGCNKVTGKALMLDEIINYVQSLQRQVEFLSMKLASVDPRQEVKLDYFTSKDIMQRNGPLPHSLYPVDSSVPVFYGDQPKLHTNVPLSQCPVEPVHKTSGHNPEPQLPSVDAFADALPQLPAFWEDDLHSIVQMGFSQDVMKETPFHSMSFPVASQWQTSP